MGAGIDLLRVWASAGSIAVPSNAKIDLGWVAGEQPAVEWENERMNSRDTRVNEIVTYLNNGVPLADVVTIQSDILSIIGTPYKTTQAASEHSASGLTGDIQTHKLRYDGFTNSLTTTGSTVTTGRWVSIDLSAKTWSITKTMDTNYSLFRMDGAGLEIATPAGASTRLIAPTVTHGGVGEAYSIPAACKMDYLPASGNLLVDNIEVPYIGTSFGGDAHVELTVYVCSVTATAPEVP